MKVVILAGGLGSRLSEETYNKPKPMVEIGGKPILWHILKIYSSYGFNEFIICCGYKGSIIKEYFYNYFIHNSDFSINIRDNQIENIGDQSEHWKITLIDTGSNTNTGGRLLRVKKYIDSEYFLFTYGDGLTNVDISKTIEFHKNHKKFATLLAVQSPGRFGALKLENGLVLNFNEKPSGDGFSINGGFFVLSREIFKFIKNDETVWETDVLPVLSKKKELMAFKHNGFWQPMDTLRDKINLETMWNKKNPPWKVW